MIEGKYKILVADDSLTIQKVIRITCANKPYELHECYNEDELFLKIASSDYDLILLDYNLSEQISGFELCEKTLTSRPNLAMMIMLGTFDVVDDAQIKELGVLDKITKPFDGNVFLEKCEQILKNKNSNKSGVVAAENESDDLIVDNIPEKIQDEVKPQELKTEIMENNQEDKNEDEWRISTSPVATETIKENEIIVPKEIETLDAIADDWNGIEIPSVIGESSNQDVMGEFPSVILEVQEHCAKEISSEEISGDPDATAKFVIDDLSVEENNPQVPKNYDLKYPESKKSSLALDLDEETKAEFTLPDEIMESASESSKELDSDILSLQEIDDGHVEIKEKLSEGLASSAEFWATDVVSKTKSKAIETENNLITKPEIDTEKIIEELKKSIRPMIEEMVSSYLKQKAEQVAWEVIPDLAENLIKSELKEISKTIES